MVLNKVDLLPAEARPKLVAKAKKRLAQTLSATKFAGCHMVAVAARPGGPGHCDQAQSSAGPWARQTSGLLGQNALPTQHVALGWPSAAQFCCMEPPLVSHPSLLGNSRCPSSSSPGSDACCRILPCCASANKAGFGCVGPAAHGRLLCHQQSRPFQVTAPRHAALSHPSK